VQGRLQKHSYNCHEASALRRGGTGGVLHQPRPQVPAVRQPEPQDQGRGPCSIKGVHRHLWRRERMRQGPGHLHQAAGHHRRRRGQPEGAGLPHPDGGRQVPGPRAGHAHLHAVQDQHGVRPQAHPGQGVNAVRRGFARPSVSPSGRRLCAGSDLQVLIFEIF